jgi:hypothetical protein
MRFGSNFPIPFTHIVVSTLPIIFRLNIDWYAEIYFGEQLMHIQEKNLKDLWRKLEKRRKSHTNISDQSLMNFGLNMLFLPLDSDILPRILLNQ